VVINWQGAALLPSCLTALAAQAAEIAPTQLELVVVDNGSTDGSVELLRREFPGVVLIALPQNLGFGEANNIALRRALQRGADFAALVNNDVEVQPGWLRALLDAAAAHPGAALFCGTLLFRDDHPERVNSTGLELDRLGRARDRDFRALRSELQREDGPVQGVSGGAALLRTSLLRRIGLFDPDYFAYYEDVELCLRAAAAGAICWYASAAVARHRFSATFGAGSPQQRALLGRGHLRTLALHGSLLKALALVPLTAWYRTALLAPLYLLRGKPAHAAAEVSAAMEGLAAAMRAVPTRFWRKMPPGAEP
jgi:GT2 family glycosyltransferase